jgi:alpha-beta hydrolase superfamily lysophospholipase
MKRIISVGVFATTLVAALYSCRSSGEFLVFGVGAILLLDRYFFRWAPWVLPIKWQREIVVRLGGFLAGTVGFYLIRLGSVPLREALMLGAATSLVLFLMEACVGVANRITHRLRSKDQTEPKSWVAACALRLPFLFLLFLAVPLEAIHPIHTVARRTPEAQGLVCEEVHFASTDGLQLAGWLLPHSHARGNVIYCHGHGRNRGQGSWMLPTLHDLGLNVLAFDFRGHGDSPGHVSTFGHQEVRDLLGAVHYFEGRCPNQPLFIVGVSLGAAVTLQSLPELPQVHGVWSEGCFSRLDTVIDHFFASVPGGLREPLVATYNYLAFLDCGFWAPDISPKEALAHVHVPICFCHGTQDQLVPFEEAQDLYQSYAGPKSHFWVTGGNHYNLRQVAHEEYLQRLRSFLNNQLTPLQLDEAE